MRSRKICCIKMGVITYVFVALALISAFSCAPVDDSTGKPPATGLSTSTATPTPENHFGETKRQAKSSKDDSSSDSEESKESAESSEEPKKRPARDSEHSGAIAEQTKDLHQGLNQTPAPVTKDVSRPQLPARETRDTHDHAPGPLSAQHGVSTLSPRVSTTARS